MKKLALVLATLMLFAACVFPVAADETETKTVKFDLQDENFIVADNDLFVGEDDGHYYALDGVDDYIVYKLTFEANATAASVVLPVSGHFVLYATPSLDTENIPDSTDWDSVWTKVAAYTDYLPAEVTEFGMDEDHGWSSLYEPHLQSVDLTEVIKKCTDNTIYLILAASDGNVTYVYDTDHRVTFAIKYSNRRYNRMNGLTEGQEGFRPEKEAIAGAEYDGFDGMAVFTYTVTEASVETDPPADTEPTDPPADTEPNNPPQTADFTAAIAMVAVVALGAAVVVSKKKH